MTHGIPALRPTGRVPVQARLGCWVPRRRSGVATAPLHMAVFSTTEAARASSRLPLALSLSRRLQITKQSLELLIHQRHLLFQLPDTTIVTSSNVVRLCCSSDLLDSVYTLQALTIGASYAAREQLLCFFHQVWES
ncbi:hypothetical protein M513_08852 [Trichuris suis]|uniref:Uncharacterized protein n=1 Tax=Trichuris suis TaxID=68888 RepID=A0A085LZ28_9BILA|nr:hypothetical protein M513_08852 [Trichuris suis]